MKNKFFLSLLLLVFVQQALGQSAIEGTVYDTSRIPLMGATVINTSTNRGTTTDFDGNFKINAKQGDKLSVSYVGFDTSYIVVKDQGVLEVILKEEVQSLSEVVVTGYQRVNSRVFTGATTQVKMEDIKLDGLADVSRLLDGRVAGLNIQNVTGTFGSAPRINIRGGASINSNVQPLWVIDGAVYEDIVSLNYDQLVSGDAVTLISSAIAGISPSDIEDVQVLKDASATSMYGARALNGVIVITTKSGKRETENNISVAYELGFRSIPTYADYDLLNSQQTMSVYDEMRSKGYLTMDETLFGRRSGVFYLMYKALNTYDHNTGSYLLKNTPEDRQSFLNKYEFANTDWFKHLFNRESLTSTYTVSFSGGGKSTANYASIGFFNDSGWTIADKVNRLTVNLKNTYFITDKLKANLIVQGSTRTQKAPGTFQQKKNTTLGIYERDFDINPFSYALNTPRLLRPYDDNGNYEYYRNNWANFNILNEYENNYMNINVLDLKIQAELEYRFNKHLKSNFMGVARRAITSNEHYVKENSNVMLAYKANANPIERRDNIYLYNDINNPNADPRVSIAQGGMLNKTENQLHSYLLRASMDFNKDYGKHTVNVFGFNEIRLANRLTNPFSGYGILYNRANHNVIPPVIFDKLQLENEGYFAFNTAHDRGVTFSASATYGYDSKYVLNLVGNYEGSNISGKGSQARWLPTWNIGAKWNVDRENWMQNQNTFSSFALRASYGLTAKMSERAVNSIAVFQPGLTFRSDRDRLENLLSLLHLENRDLTWEKMYELNTGVDLGFLENKLTVSLDAYLRNSFDLIDLVRTSGVGGEYYKYANFADMTTKGIEFTLDASLINTQDFKWNVRKTVSYYDQKITRMLNTPNTFDLVSGTGRGNVVGKPRGSLYSFQAQGLDQYGLPVFDFGNYPLGTSNFAKSTGADFYDSRYSLSYLTYNGPVEPNITGGFSNTFTYKNFELSFFINYQFGNKVRLQPTYDPNFADLNVFASYYNDRWINPGDEQRTYVPGIPSKDLIKLVGDEAIRRAYNTFNYSQHRVADGGFIRMKSISLAYRMPSIYLKQIGVKSFVLRAQVTNPFLIYSDAALNGQDPEFYRAGGVSLPISRQYTTSLNFSF